MEREKVEAISTLEAVKQWFSDEGVSVSRWARENGLPAAVVYSLLAGKSRGQRGVSHQAALALGLKVRSNSALPPPGRILVRSASGGFSQPLHSNNLEEQKEHAMTS